MVGGYEARAPLQVPGLALEVVLLPDSGGVVGVRAGRTLEDDFCSLLGNAVGHDIRLLLVSSHVKCWFTRVSTATGASWYGWMLTGPATEKLSVWPPFIFPAANYIEKSIFHIFPSFLSIMLHLCQAKEGLRPKKMIPTEIAGPGFLDFVFLKKEREYNKHFPRPRQASSRWANLSLCTKFLM